MQLVVQALLTNYITYGNGSRVALFLHGWADSGQTFNSLAKQFVAENADYTAVLLDLPGFGKTQAPKEAWGLNDYARFAHDFTQKLGLEPYIVVGHSNGGAVAINALANNDLVAKGLILIGSAGIRTPSGRKTFLKVASVPAKIVLSLAPQSVQKRIKRKAYGAIGSDYMVSEHMQETFKKIVATDVRYEAEKIKVPVSLIYGADDTATPPSYGTLFKSVMPQAQLVVVPEATHFVHQEQVYKVATIMSGFVKSL